jgi:hypothetical protein
MEEYLVSRLPKNYNALSAAEKNQLLAFLDSL